MKTVFNKLIDISLNITDGVHNTVVDDANGNCFLLSAKNIKNGLVCFDNSDRKISEDVRTKLNKRTKMTTGDILFTTVGTLGEAALVDERCEMYEFQRSVAIIKPNEKLIDNKYLYYLLKSNSYNYYFKSIATGAAQPCIFIGNLGKTKIEYFEDINYQKRISDILYSYDSLIENNNKRIIILEKMAENLYKEWFVRFRFPGYETVEFENGIPVGWEIKQLSDVADVVMGQSPSSENYNENKQGLPFHQGVGSYGDFYLQDNIYSTEGRRIAQPNSIIFSVRAPVGRININLNKVILGRGVASINSKYSCNSFLLWQLKNCFSKEDIIGNGAIFTSVTKDELSKYKLIKPTDELMRKFNEMATKIELQIRAIYLSTQNLTKQRDLLLPRLMSGKLEV